MDMFALLKKFNAILCQEKISVMRISAVNEITDPKLGVPNHSYQCSTCGAKDTKKCEGALRQVIYMYIYI